VRQLHNLPPRLVLAGGQQLGVGHDADDPLDRLRLGRVGRSQLLQRGPPAHEANALLASGQAQRQEPAQRRLFGGGEPAVGAFGRLLHCAQHATRLAVGSVGQRVALAALAPGAQQNVGQQGERAGDRLLARAVTDVAQECVDEALLKPQAMQGGRPFNGAPQFGAAHRRQVDLGLGHRLAQAVDVLQPVVEVGAAGDQDAGVAAAGGRQ